MTEKEEKIFLLKYEVDSSILAARCSINWMQKLLSRYFALKVNRKYERMKWREEFRNLMNDLKELNK